MSGRAWLRVDSWCQSELMEHRSLLACTLVGIQTATLHHAD